jgi:predicted permease
MFLTLLQETLQITVPIFLVVISGYGLRHLGLLDDHFISMGSRLVFNFTLPILLFISIATKPLTYGVTLTSALVGVAATLLIWALIEFVSRWLVHPRSDRGVVVMCSFRSNLGIVGLAYCFNAYGETGVAAVAMYLALVTTVYNVVSVITLSRKQSNVTSIRLTLKSISRNPLIIAIVISLLWSVANLPVPSVLNATGNYFATMTLPLALLCAGGSLSLKAFKNNVGKVWLATFAKLALTPLVTFLLGYMVGLRGMHLELIVMMSCAPTAAASYAMARAMGSNDKLAASIVAITTLLSFATAAIIISLLRISALV